MISGAVKINSYTAETRDDWFAQPGEEIPAVKHPAVVVRDNDPACVLTPEDRNFHEITCVEGPGVFLDILSPPYIIEPCIPDTRLRPCTYFREISSEHCTESEETDTQVHLVGMTKPPDFYSRCIKYRGPTLR